MFCPQFRPVVGGAERQAEKLAIALVAAGCRVTLVTPRIDPDSPDIEESNGVRIERFPLYDLSHRYPIPGIALLNIPAILWQVARAVHARLKGVDVVHCHIASLQTAGAALAGRLCCVPVLCKAAVADHRSDFGEIEKSGFSGHFIAWLIRVVIPHWIATTVAVEQALIRAGANSNHIVRIPNGIDLPENTSHQARCNRVRRFLYLGRLSLNTQRDVPSLIRAFDRLAVKHPEVELAIVGGGDLLESTQVQVNGCNAQHRIYVPGFDKPEKWLAWADCFVLPSRREGLSNALLEAMAAGLPCIANDIAPNREVLSNGKAGVLVPVGDEDRLHAEMGRMATDSEHARAFSARSFARVRSHYLINSVADQYIELYKQVTKICKREKHDTCK